MSKGIFCDNDGILVDTEPLCLRCLVIPDTLTRAGDFSSAERVLADIREVPAALHDLAPC